MSPLAVVFAFESVSVDISVVDICRRSCLDGLFFPPSRLASFRHTMRPGFVGDDSIVR